MDHSKIASKISRKARVALHPASALDVMRLKRLRLPQTVISFFSIFEPSETAEIDGVRLSPVDGVIGENTDYVPGANLSPKGYVVIATTEYGDAYCVDLNVELDGHHPIILMSHEVDWQDLSDEEIKSSRTVVASSFEQFLEFFASGKLDIEVLNG